MRKKIGVIFVFSLLCFRVFTQDLCTIQNTEVLGVAGGAWLRQSFTPTVQISNPTVAVPIYSPDESFFVGLKFYQGSVWSDNPLLISENIFWIEQNENWWPSVGWAEIFIPNITLMPSQQYFVEINNISSGSTIFSFGQAGSEDLFIGGEQRDPLTSQSTSSVWFSDIAIRVQGDCGSICLGDFDHDGLVGVNDLIIFLSTFGCIGDCSEQDFNNDLVIGTADLMFFMSLFGSLCE